MIRRIWCIAAITLLVAACGDDDDGSSAAASTTSLATSTVEVTTVAPTTAPRTTTAPSTTSVSTSVAGSVAGTTAPACSQSPAFDPNGSLRDQFVAYLESCGFTQSESACLFDHLDFDDPAVLAGDPDAMLPAFEACDIDADRMDELGAP
jgi:hypothetical protein